jgi:unsaturated chondroitin disaccharide hydrolase
LTGNEDAREIALLAADNLLSRYHEKGGFIQAWGELGAPENYRLIVDCLLNIPLLYWATEVTGDERYKKVGYTHFRTTIENVLRDDGTTFHTFYFDPETGRPVKGVTAQGMSDDSCWSRGQAWGIYGLVMTMKYADDPDAVEVCQKLVNVFLNRLPKDYVPFWDLEFTDGDNEPRDSSAAAIAVCGILELMKYLPEAGARQTYQNAADLIMNSLYTNYSTKDVPKSNGLLLHATYSKPGGLGIDECNIWGCYFYLEALTRLSKNWDMYW